MSTIRQRKGKFQARIQRRGFPTLAKTFLTQREALQWARQAEIGVERASISGNAKRLTVREMVDRYATEVTPSKKGARSERLRLKAWARSSFGSMWVDEVRSNVLAKWRDGRLSSGLAGSTVRNDLNTLSAVYRHTASEWGYQHLANPVARLKRPPPGKARTRRVSEDEIARVKSATESAYLAALIDLAIETGMRLSELVSLRWNNLDLDARTAFLPDTKNGHPRTVPLSSKAALTLRNLRQGVVQRLDGALFPVTPHAVTVAFRRACKRVQKASGGSLAVNLRFHDLRHEAVSRLFERGLNPMEVAVISGHRSMQMLARYTHIHPTSLLAKLG
jgi:integrase